jgi:hypothetical protein
MRLLYPFHNHRDVINSKMFSGMIDPIAGQPLMQDLQHFCIGTFALFEIDTQRCKFVRRHAPANPDIKPPTAQIIKHQEFFQQPDWLIQGKKMQERSQTNAFRFA